MFLIQISTKFEGESDIAGYEIGMDGKGQVSNFKSPMVRTLYGIKDGVVYLWSQIDSLDLEDADDFSPNMTVCFNHQGREKRVFES